MSLILKRSRKADRELYNSAAEEFIPIACHYDENTLLTKNGELLQIIQINGINAERISDKLLDLREMVRSAIRDGISSNNFAFWIHTVRRKTNLDDTSPYSKLLPANIHNLWRQKNFWDDKFVNTLYISVIYDSAEIKVKNFSSFVNSLFVDTILDFQQNYFKGAFQQLNTTVNKMLAYLNEYGAVKLGIRFEGEEVLSDPLALYHKIVHLNENRCLVPIADFSSYLASNQYAVGSDKIEVIGEGEKNFTAILSLKEYQEVSSEALDTFLQLPVELIATEIFYFVDQKEVVPIFNEQDYIVKVSGDNVLRTAKGLENILAIASSQSVSKFCQQQISIAIMGTDLEKLDRDIEHASKRLSEVGIVHVREDINLEQTFWAQLPGNFSYLRRLAPTTSENTAALTALHNFPTGNQYSKWGKAITLLRTEKGTPYFMNFHVGDKGNTCIFGNRRGGKTILTNFLISEATKFNPSILYLADNNDSKIFIEAIEGQWIETPRSVINPFLCEDTPASRQFIHEFLKIICNHYIAPLSDLELAFLATLTDKIFAINIEDRNFSSIIKNIDFTVTGANLIESRLSLFKEGGLYYGLFDENPRVKLARGGVVGLNLYNFTDEYFTKQFFPEDKKLIDQFTTNLALNKSVSFAIVYAIAHYFQLANEEPKILVVDNMTALLDQTYFSDQIASIFSNLSLHNGIIVGNINLNLFQSLKPELWQKWLGLIDTSVILPVEKEINKLGGMLQLSKIEIKKLSSLTAISRMFLVKQDNSSIVTELSIGGFVGIVKMLSSGAEELAIYQKILQEHSGHPDNWISPLHKALEG